MLVKRACSRPAASSQESTFQRRSAVACASPDSTTKAARTRMGSDPRVRHGVPPAPQDADKIMSRASLKLASPALPCRPPFAEGQAPGQALFFHRITLAYMPHDRVGCVLSWPPVHRMTSSGRVNCVKAGPQPQPHPRAASPALFGSADGAEDSSVNGAKVALRIAWPFRGKVERR
jgi:hypothetical protein